MPNVNVRAQGLVEVTAATVTINEGGYSGLPIKMNRAAGITATLPAATGSGAKYEFYGAVDASGSQIIRAASASDVMQGVAIIGGEDFNTADTSDTITLNATTTGGFKGWKVFLVDIASGVWDVLVISESSGTAATPFSAAV